MYGILRIPEWIKLRFIHLDWTKRRPWMNWAEFLRPVVLQLLLLQTYTEFTSEYAHIDHTNFMLNRMLAGTRPVDWLSVVGCCCFFRISIYLLQPRTLSLTYKLYGSTACLCMWDRLGTFFMSTPTILALPTDFFPFVFAVRRFLCGAVVFGLRTTSGVIVLTGARTHTHMHVHRVRAHIRMGHVIEKSEKGP